MKSAQSSVEFLFTYGWAILAVSVSIGALAYFNVSSPENIIPQGCDLGPQFDCVEYALYENSTLTLNIRNNHNILVQINNVTIHYKSEQETYSTPFNISSGEIEQLNMVVPDLLASDLNVKKMTIDINFKNPNSNSNYVFVGTINTGVISS